MTSFTYSGMFSNACRIPDDVQHLIIDESVGLLPDEICRERQQLLQIEFPSRLLQLGDRAFEGCTAVKQIALPSRLMTIGKYSFHLCVALMDVSLPEGLRKIGEQSFSMCPNLKRITVPSTVETIENAAFSKCHSLSEVILLEGLIHIGDRAFFECYFLPVVTVPESVQRIGCSAFSRCTLLVAIGLPSRYQVLKYAFAGCLSLEAFNIPSGIDSIPEGLFTGCASLSDVRLHEGLTRIGANAFSGSTSLVTLKLPSTVSTILTGAFAGCTSLAEVGISEGLVEIGSLSFLGCVSLSRIRVPSTVRRIDQAAFSGCISLVTVEVSEKRQGPLRIGDSAFRKCKSLINISISYESDIKIHTNALDGCDLLEDAFGDSDPFWAMSDRFNEFPIHKKCYHSCDTTVNEFQQELESFPLENGGGELLKLFDCDSFGMTPFHVLLSAASRRLDLLELLSETYPSYVLDWKDESGKRAIDYLSPIWNEETKALMQSYLQKWLIARLEGWGMIEWRSDMTERVHSILVEDDRARRESIMRDTCSIMKRYERVETMALLELALWKKDMVSCANGAPLSEVSDREAHRAKCGATFVVPNVIAFLEDMFRNDE